jgi:flagellin-like hook-associated protein FlgL
MATINPIPSGRSSDALMSRRMLSQLQIEQQRMLRAQQQMGTGRRIQLPSEDPTAASRGWALQSALEIKTQLRTNLSAGQSYLAATDTALSGVADLLSNVRGLSLRAVDTGTGDLERNAIALEVQATVQQLLSVGNQAFRGRYLFAGSLVAQRPFEMVGGQVAYRGNDQSLRTWADTGLPVDTNVAGQTLFGAVSAEMRGQDLNPTLTAATKVADLRGGEGIRPGTIVISDGVRSSTVVIRGADTVQDVVRLIEANPPPGRQLRVTIGERGLNIELEGGGGSGLAIRDVLGGSTAVELGIARQDLMPGPIVGADLNPAVRPSTRLDDVLGSRASAVLRSAGEHNDLVLEARQRGTAPNGFTLQLVDDNLLQGAAGLSVGSEVAELDSAARAARGAVRLSGAGNDLIVHATQAGVAWNQVQISVDASQSLGGDAAHVTFDAATRSLTIHVDAHDRTTVGSVVAAVDASGWFTAVPDSSRGETYDPAAIVWAADHGIVGGTGNSGGEPNTIYVHIAANGSTANHVAAALRANADIDALFQVRLDPRDTARAELAGSRPVDVQAFAVTAGGTGFEWDQDSGLQITNGGQSYVVDIRAAETVEDLLNALNASGAMVLAEINQQGNGINVRSRLSGSDLTIGEHGGSTATDLGLRSMAATTELAALNYRRGVDGVEGTDFVIRRRDGVELAVDVSSAQTIGEVLHRINQHPDNLDPATAVLARLALWGNGIELVDANAAGTETLVVRRAGSSPAAWDLGLIPRGAVESAPPDPLTPPGTGERILGRDVNPIETEGVFNTLIRLQQAITLGDVPEIQRLAAMLDDDFDRFSFGRADVGARAQALDALAMRNADEQVELNGMLSETIDVDMAEAVSEFLARQATYEASLRTMASMMRLSLLDLL